MSRSSARRTFRSVARLAILGAALVGCNAILDNKAATFDPSALSAEPPDAGPASGDAGSEPPASAIDDAGEACSQGTRRCGASCAAPDDPAFGCGSPSCTPCLAPNGTAVCTLSGCGIAACDPGRADCNGDPRDGCEVDLSKAESCGRCGAACPAARPYCAPDGTRFACTNGCAPAAPLLCDTSCVSPQTDPNHCGGCGKKCAAVDNADVACADGGCTFTCKPTYHACDGRCALDTDPKACGPTCLACPAPSNANPNCQSNACSFQCKTGFGNCNQDPADGCETPLATSALHCGACDKKCPDVPNAQPTCNAGACAFTCSPGFADCNNDPKDGCEVNLGTDALHCGRCATICAAGATCRNGACVAGDAGP